MKLDRSSSLGLVFSATHLLILMAALTSRCTNSTRALTLVELATARIAGNRALCVTTVLSSSRLVNTFSRLSPLFSSSSLALLRSIFGEKRIFSVSFGQPTMTAFQDPGLPCPYFVLGFFTSSNERTSGPSAINREKAFAYTHLGSEYH